MKSHDSHANCHAISHAYPACLPVASCSNNKIFQERMEVEPAEAQSEISCKVSERLQRLPKPLLRSEMMEVLLPGETRLEVSGIWK